MENNWVPFAIIIGGIIGNYITCRSKKKIGTEIYNDYIPTSYKYNTKTFILENIESTQISFSIGQIILGKPNCKIEGTIKSGSAKFLEHIEVKDSAGNVLGRLTFIKDYFEYNQKFEVYFKEPRNDYFIIISEVKRPFNDLYIDINSWKRMTMD
jgi:hypothetical protein